MNNHPASKKILVFVKSIDGGTGTFILSLQKLPGFINRKTLIKTLVIEKPLYRKVNKDSFEYIKRRSSVRKYSFSISNTVFFILDLMWYLRKVKEFDPDVVITIDIYCNLIALVAKYLFFLKTKIIITTHNNIVDTIRFKTGRFMVSGIEGLIRIFYPRADYLVVVSKGIRKSLKKDFGIRKEVNVIYYGLDKRYLSSRFPQKRKFSSNIVLSIGRLDLQKDFKTLIEAFYLFSKKNDKANLWIVGNGPLENDLRQLILKFKLGSKVKMLGWRQNILPLLKKAHSFVLSTNREGFGYVIIEAMSQGLPIIVSDVNYGPSEILDNGKYGILVKKNDSVSLSKNIYKLSRNDKYYEHFTKQSYLRSSFFTEEKMLHSYASLIKKL